MFRLVPYVVQILFLLGVLQAGFSTPDAQADITKRPPIFIESIELKGTTRLESNQLIGLLQLDPGIVVDDKLVANIKQKLLGLGLFRYVLVSMKKGSARNKAKLEIEVEDDETVLTDWALGGGLSLTQSENQSSSVPTDSSPFSYRFSLIGRNVLSRLHRGALTLDLDASGELRTGKMAYGFPRFAAEDVQFDAYIEAIDPRFRFLDSQAFGGRGAGIWSRSLEDTEGHLQYGVAMFVNEGTRFRVPGFPKSVAGPLIGYALETRLIGFYPTEGHAAKIAAVLPPGDTEKFIVDVRFAKTIRPIDNFASTFAIDLVNVGRIGHSFRGEAQFDMPFIFGAKHAGEAAAFFTKLRYGQDVNDDYRFNGSSTILGLRYHSSGFIAELAFKITSSPIETGSSNANLEGLPSQDVWGDP